MSQQTVTETQARRAPAACGCHEPSLRHKVQRCQGERLCMMDGVFEAVGLLYGPRRASEPSRERPGAVCEMQWTSAVTARVHGLIISSWSHRIRQEHAPIW